MAWRTRSVKAGRLEERLGRDAAAVEARAADLVLVDEGDLEAELGGTEGRRVPAGARAEHDEIEVVGRADGHGSGCLGAPRSRRQASAGQVGHRDRWYARCRDTRNRGPAGRLMLDSAASGVPCGQGSPIAVGACLVDPAIVLRTVVLVLIAYLAGSIPMGVLVARLTGGTDPRTIGSGRTGGTNALRALGTRSGRDRRRPATCSRAPCRSSSPGTSRAAIRWSRSCAARPPWPGRSGRCSPGSGAVVASGPGSGRCSSSSRSRCCSRRRSSSA